jgi:F0F1-type ATP synthase alpha subunit
LFLLKENYLDTLEMEHIKRFAVNFASYVKGTYVTLYNSIKKSQVLSDVDIKELKKSVEEFKLIFSKT